jgi:hypothetical protein
LLQKIAGREGREEKESCSSSVHLSFAKVETDKVERQQPRAFASRHELSVRI